MVNSIKLDFKLTNEKLSSLNNLIINVENSIKGNCFNAVQLIHSDVEKVQHVKPEPFIVYIRNNFEQISNSSQFIKGDVFVIWSRSNNSLPVGNIKVASLTKEKTGYPFGLVIEHAFVTLENGQVFQKRNPSINRVYEVIPFKEAVAPYRNLYGFEMTLHRRGHHFKI